ncbi:unnamed protein product [Mytilus edulis]|uniref:Uncharacterized protein n=1 Tax=Mytilus edulis TaxID=6550 RepID=A0A8S3SNH8_MYTED|nr:unnamed protein product [Mytilus edulis]
MDGRPIFQHVATEWRKKSTAAKETYAKQAEEIRADPFKGQDRQGKTQVGSKELENHLRICYVCKLMLVLKSLDDRDWLSVPKTQFDWSIRCLTRISSDSAASVNRYVLVVWTRENNVRTISFRSIVSPRKKIADYRINEAVIAKYREKLIQQDCKEIRNTGERVIEEISGMEEESVEEKFDNVANVHLKFVQTKMGTQASKHSC